MYAEFILLSALYSPIGSLYQYVHSELMEYEGRTVRN